MESNLLINPQHPELDTAIVDQVYCLYDDRFLYLQFRDGYENLYRQQVTVKKNNRNPDTFEFIVGSPKLVI